MVLFIYLNTNLKEKRCFNSPRSFIEISSVNIPKTTLGIYICVNQKRLL